MKLPFFCTLALLAAGINSHAELIRWFSVPGKTNLTSTNAAMTGDFNFALGVFANDFTPTAANLSEWATHWRSVQQTAYDAPNSRFGEEYTVTGAELDFTVGKAAYVWGVRGGATRLEWILFRKSTWTVPAASDPPNPIALEWDAAEAMAIVGTIDGDGSPFLMQSAPVWTWSQWQATALAGEPLNAPGDDPDRDGVSNLLEFVFGLPPLIPGAVPVTPVELVTVSSQRYLQLTIPRRADHLATLSVEVSSDLSLWNSGPGHTVTVSNTPAAWVVRDLTPVGPGTPHRFMRLKAQLP